ncbi:ABC-type sugar transport system, permease component [[Actinomadura] parvosata subsp. kistnae]|uniref:carbohydrate ABC transporter permease n=1 Tax=[Actinomadura] parvosata TaxID=1955412 RepID=UPI000D2BEB11|nr:sugar ABC transporter permease [Nonomuraea sp. ATCC 55076]SPL99213.1 ABC-type sugar transport system, permease component [Actinomadura parvosata subsp. kistnae]
MAVGVTRPKPGRAPSGTRGSRARRARRPGARHFLLFAAPGTLVYVCLVLVPIVMSVGYSLTDQALLRPTTSFVGLRNYRLLLQDETFLQSLKVTTILTLIVVVVPNVLGVAIAVLLDRRGWLYNALRGVFFTPMVISSVVISVIWTRVLADDGPVNQALRALGVQDPPGWLSDPDIALYSLSSIVCWQLLGFCVVVYLAGLQGVPQELAEAAAIDGAGPVRRFWSVTWPLLAPALTINTVVLLISAFKIFDHVKVITNGGPGTGTTASVAFVVLQEGFVDNRTGYASAEAVVMLVVIAALSVLTLRILGRREVQL